MLRENLLLFLDHFLSCFWIFVAIGILHGMIQERSLLKNILQRKNKWVFSDFSPLFIRWAYVLGGLLLLLASWLCVSTLVQSFFPFDLDLAAVDQNQGLARFIGRSAEYVGLTCVTGMMISATFLTISAGSRWLVNGAKIFFTATILYFFLHSLWAYGFYGIS